jgi:HAD superfamily hydrolase (TIGR01509 family)
MRESRRRDLRAVFLDLDDTLSDELHHMRAAYAAALAGLPERLESGVAAAVLDTYMDIGIDLYRRNAWDEMPREERLKSALQRAGVEPLDLPGQIVEGYFRNYREGLRLLPGAGRLLDIASRYRTCLITNGLSDRQREKIERLGLAGRFDHVLISEEFGTAKPDSAIFRRALSLTEVEPHQAVMIGDNALADITGAAALGMHTIWVNLHGWALPAAAATPEHEVPDVAAAAARLERPSG